MLQNNMWIEDAPGDAKITVAKSNSGFNKRKELIAEGKQFHFESYIFSDIFWVSKYLLPNISMVSK